ncbi:MULTISPECIES: NRAMP family divalent metal transporter [Rhizobium]|uniref:Mn2+/Fe2+ transporter protein n=2 Tax=Rhizobium TaxID=379 RepID=A0ABN4QL74_9HYPH|nr:Mn2+/Fe2+ transporter protein [Rhizobium phaseoli]ARM13819.1 Mn2+/Fe2+ transporter protein [Rhizobium phaseoli Brasil 5]MDH6649479.1 Mn2+/Fe2+ NRAMP family transporter [Rhizobium esperanzae]ANL48299.1 Mn2+/Fe2+ transporter protein [Rhizobium phaseoli]ANL54742.1 Mn2+/Fe2+ transporter protein [Rhizobium phaseoli]
MEQPAISSTGIASPVPSGISVKSRRSALMAAIFLMSMSAVGPGFITQTATFTVKLGAAFAFGIIVSILIDFIVQANIWRIVTITRMRASDIANAAIPGSGYLLAALVIIGGLFFNIGNIGGAGLGFNAMIDLDPKIGGLIGALAAIGIFLSRRAGVAMDRVVYVAAFIKLALILYATIVSGPPIAEALRQTVLPDVIDFATITTIVGGTVGGYITYAGAHRLLDKGTVGVENLGAVNRAALSGIAITGMLRYILFLAVLGVVASGAVIDLSGKAANPAGQAFHAAAGDIGLRLFGAVFLASAMTSIIGAAYTSVSFLTAFKKDMPERQRNFATVGFIAISLIAYMLITTPPAAMLVFVGGLNGLVLPVGLSIFMYAVWARSDLLGGYRYPRWLLVLGVLTCVLTWYMGYKSIGPIFALLTAA